MARVLSKTTVLLILVLSIATYGNSSPFEDDSHEPHTRVKRGIISDFFTKIFVSANLALEQYNDSKNTLNEVYNLVADSFSDTQTKSPPTTTTVTPDPLDVNATTTERYRISRYEFGRITGRNFRGLKRLMQLELNDALNASKYNIQEYKEEAARQYANGTLGAKAAAAAAVATSTTVIVKEKSIF